MKKQSFLKGSAVLLGMVLVTKALGLVYKIPLTSMLGGGGMSCYSGAFAVFTPVFAAAAAGVPSAMSRLVSQQLALGRYSGALRFRRAAFLIFGTLSGLLTVLMAAFSGVLAERVIHIPSAKYAVAAVSLTIFPAAMMNVHRGWSEGLGSMNPTASSEILETAVKLILGLALPYAVMRYAAQSFAEYHGCFGHYCADSSEMFRTAVPYAAAASCTGVAAASWAALLYLTFLTRRINAGFCAEETSSLRLRTAAKLLLKQAVPASLTAVAATLTSLADLMTVPTMLEKAMSRCQGLYPQLNGIPSAERAGFIYGAYTGLALTVYGLVPTFTAMLGKSILPRLSAACAGGDSAEVRHSLRAVLLLSAAIAMPSGAVIFGFPKEILGLLFAGSPTEAALCVRPLAILGISAVFMGISLPCLTALQACDKQGSAVTMTLAGSALKLILNIILIQRPEFGLSGAAAAMAASQGLILVFTLIVLIRGTGASAECLSVLLIPILPTAGAMFAAKLCQAEFEAPIFFPLCVGAAVYFAMMLILNKKEL